MAYYPDEWLDEVRMRNDIVEVVSDYVRLKQNGRRHTGLCPFHSEKTPSFSVDAEKQMYYCFGCHAGGNVFRFVMDIEHMEFPEAARHLAERARMQVPDGREERGPSREVKDRLYAALTEAARWFNKRLYAPEGKAALDYLHGRGIGDNTIRRFGIGVSGDGWDQLTRALTDAGFTRKELEDANLAVVRGESAFDMFRSRAIFPIFDARGRVVAFGGRILGEGQPKYLNSSDTPVFNKRRTVYGLNFLKGTRERLTLVEGYMDVVSLSQHGVHGCVATLGTALTSDQARLIKRKAGETGEIIIAYDGDTAGQRATRRALDIFSVEGVSCKVAVIPGGQDPDDFVRANGGQAFSDLPLLSAIEYLMAREKDQVDLGSLEGRTAYATAVAKILKTVDSPVEIENHVKRLAVETGFPRDVLYEQIGRSPKMRLTATVSGNTRNQYRDTNKANALPDHVKAQRQLLSLLAAQGENIEFPVAVEDFTDPECRAIAQRLRETAGGPMAVSRILDGEEDEEKRALISAILMEEVLYEQDQLDELLRSLALTIRRHALEQSLQEMRETLAGQSRLDEELLKKYTQTEQLYGNLFRPST